MVDKLQKALNKLADKERVWIKSIMQNIHQGKITGYDLKKLQGHDDIFRIRKGSMRIIFRIISHEEVRILAIEWRSNTTYDSF